MESFMTYKSEQDFLALFKLIVKINPQKALLTIFNSFPFRLLYRKSYFCWTFLFVHW